jgi:hypothetical protein
VSDQDLFQHRPGSAISIIHSFVSQYPDGYFMLIKGWGNKIDVPKFLILLADKKPLADSNIIICRLRH